MRLVAAFLRSSFDAAMSLLVLFGAKGPRWEWKKSQWKMSLEARLASWEMTERGIRAPLRMCRSCRELVDRSLSTCPACGASMHGVPGGGAGRVLAAVLPQFSNLTAVLITANVVLLALPLILWGASPRSSGIFGILAPPGEALFVFGSKYTPFIVGLGQVWRLVTAGFLHAGIVHLGFNCYALSILGPLIENSFGWRKFLFVYVLSDIAAFAVSAVFSPQVPSVGASGPLFGLLGFAVVYGRYRAGPGGRAVSDQLLNWIVMAVVMSFMPGIDTAAHVGGFACGAILAFLVNSEEPQTRRGRAIWAVLTALTIAILVGSFVAMLVSYPGNVQRLAG